MVGTKETLKVFFTSYISCKVLYFLEFAFFSSFLPYVAIYLRVGAGLQPWMIGLLTSLLPFMSFIFTPLFTFFTDKYDNHRVVLLITTIASGCFLTLLMLVGDNVVGVFFATLCFSIAQSPISPLADYLVIKALGQDRQLYGQSRLWGAPSWGLISFITGMLIDRFNNIHIVVYSYLFWMTFFIGHLIITSFKSQTSKIFNQLINIEIIDSSSKLFNFINSNHSNNNSTLDLNNIDKQQQQQSQVVQIELNEISTPSSEGSICKQNDDQSMSGSSVGSVNDNLNQLNQDDLNGINNNGDGSDGGAIITNGDSINDSDNLTLLEKSEKMVMEDIDMMDDNDGATIRMTDGYGDDVSRDTYSTKLTTSQLIRGVFSNPQFMIFLFAVMITGMSQNIISNFLFLFLKDHLNASTTLLGATLPFTVIMELPFFFFGKQMLERVGIKWMIVMGHAAFIVRLTAYNIFAIPNISPWWVMPIEILHGVAFACIWTAGIEYATTMSPKGYEATYQGIFAGINGGLGSGIGSVVGGFFFQHIGPLALFRFSAITTTISLLIFLSSIAYYGKKVSSPFHKPNHSNIIPKVEI